MKSPQSSGNDMEHTLAMQIVGAVLVLVAIMKNRDPIGMNKSIFGDVEGIEGGPAASMRMLIGGGFAGIGAINLYCSFNVDDAAAGEAILVGTAIGLALVFGTIVSAKLRGYMENIPTPPLVIFPSLIAICLYSAMM
ncbi:MAG: hypothetical protein CMA79_03510 [Euryarchaeota archaeon]|nr:hypothetical protein [Euryarchaeota archaeon]MBN55486.1 hypothetical protein [Euryarchaeota archaeon]|tara:strand:- start:1348 stop:1758 length:411 start_codon:yes stop_codon:yes gene_type:complete